MRKPMPTIAGLARAELDRLRKERAAKAIAEAEAKGDSLAGLGLLDFIPALQPQYVRPVHFAPLVDLLERAVAGEPQRAVVHGPPQHGKTSLVQSAIGWGLRKKPNLVFGYATYADRLARSKSRKARTLAKLGGVKLVANAVNEWRTAEDGGLLATGVGGPLTGNRVDIMIIDDPTKNRADAESPAYRERLAEWFNDVVNTRVHPGGSIFCFGTRWHPEDLGGFLIKEYGFRYLCFPAISGEPPNEVALAPNLFKVEDFKSKRRNAYTWASLYQGQPRARGKTVFDPPPVSTEWPKVFQHAFGVDGAYTAKTSADWSACVRLLRFWVPGDELPHFLVAHAQREQCRLPTFRTALARLHALYPGAVGWRWYVATTEQGGADMLSDTVIDESGEKLVGAPVHGVLAKGDKYARALAVSEAWNAGRIHVPANAPWLEEFLAEVMLFTGLNDAHDDFVDALAAAFDLLDSGPSATVEPLKPLQHRGLAAQEM